MATLLPEGKQSFTNSAGAPLVGGKVYTYDAGTNSPRPTYADAAGTVPNANPVVLDARGEATIFWSGAYKVVLKDAADVTIWTVDNVSGLSALDLAGAAGAGMVGFDYAQAYPAGSIGKWLKDLATSVGSTFIGFLQAGANAVLRTIEDKARERVTAADYGFTPGNVAAYSAATLNSIIAVLAAQGKKLEFAAGTYLWDNTIIIPNGGSIEGAGSGYSNNAKAFTKFVCTSNVASSVVRFYDAVIPGYIEAYCVGIWATYQTQFDHVTFAGNNRAGFFLDNQLTNSTLDDLYASECRYGYYAPKSIWSSKVGTLSVTLCYMGWFSGPTDYATSLQIQNLQIWRCFHGAAFSKMTYCTVSGYLDSCGLNAATPARLQVANEVPLGLVFSEAKGVFVPYWGSEQSKMIQIVASNFSTVKVGAMRLDQPAAALWRYDAARAYPAWMPAMASTKQALFLTSDSALEISGLSSSLTGSAPTANDLFAATTESLAVTSDQLNGILFENCFVDAPAYVIDYPKSSTNPAAAYYSNNIRAINTLKQFLAQATTNLGLGVYIGANGVGDAKLTPTVWDDRDWRRYKLQKATGQEGWEAGTTMALNLNVRLGLDYWSASLRIVLQPSEAAGAARATVGVQEVLLDVVGNSNVVTGCVARSATGGVTVGLDGAHPTFILINGLVNRINFDVFVEETVNRFCRADFPVTVVAS